jgi:hypothetical protein
MYFRENLHGRIFTGTEKYNDEIPCEISWKKNELKKIFHEIPGGASRYISTFFGPRTT